jgi:hypothetical protein
VVIVHNSELFGKSDDSTGTTGSKFGSELLEKVFTGRLSSGWSGTADISAENFGGKFTVFKNTGFIGIVNGVERIQILLGWDHDANFLDCLGELIGLDGSVVV